MWFYFLGFLRRLSDPPISIFPLNQLAFNNYHGGGGWGSRTSLFFFFPEKLKCVTIRLGVGGTTLSLATASQHPLQNILKPSFSHFDQQGISFCSEPQNIFIDKNTSSLWPRFLKIKTRHHQNHNLKCTKAKPSAKTMCTRGLC